MPTSSLDSRTPYEALTGIKPNVGNLRVFGCTAYSHVPKDERNKLSSKATKCTFLGYPCNSKGYRLYDSSKKKVIVSRDVIFNEFELGVLLPEEPNPNKYVELTFNDFSDEVQVEPEQPVGEGGNRCSEGVRRPPDRYGDWVYSSSEGDSPPSNVVEAMASSESTNWVTAMNLSLIHI